MDGYSLSAVRVPAFLFRNYDMISLSAGCRVSVPFPFLSVVVGGFAGDFDV